mmetsp:Transcript_68901/g.132921  ORF Transcript_68901/g.132921 Transcript_68901/m.132921 type:complete len:400 (-) Transcript_68901:411-1610(-)
MATSIADPWVLAASKIITEEPGIGYRTLHDRLKADGFEVARKTVQNHLASHRAASESTPLPSSSAAQSPQADSKQGRRNKSSKVPDALEEPAISQSKQGRQNKLSKTPDTLAARNVIVEGPTAEMIRLNGLSRIGLCIPRNAPAPTPMGLHHTGLSANQVPASLNTPIPIFTHDECNQFLELQSGDQGLCVPMISMTPKAIATRYGEETSKALCIACQKFSPTCLNVQGPADVWRHVLAAYFVQQPSGELPLELGDFIAGFFNEGASSLADVVLKQLLGSNADRKRPEIRLAIQSELAPAKVVTVILLVLSETMDIWHPQNKSSPVPLKLLNSVRKRAKQRQMKAFEDNDTDCKVDPATRSKEDEEDQEFAGLSFEDVLAEEKLHLERHRGGHRRVVED